MHNTIGDHVDHVNNGKERSCKANMWKSLDIVFKFYDKKMWTTNDHEIYQIVLDEFKGSVLDAWKDQHITHYMVYDYYSKLVLEKYVE